MSRITQTFKTYQVQIRYREPSYELHAGPKPHPYSWTYSISATSSQEAADIAQQEFKRAFQDSHVGWVRTIVSIDVTETSQSST